MKYPPPQGVEVGGEPFTACKGASYPFCSNRHRQKWECQLCVLRTCLDPPAEEEDQDVFKRSSECFLLEILTIFRARREDIEMVKCIGKFSLLMKRLRDAWMDLLPMSATSEQVTSHGRLVPFSDNLTTLMFTVASDLSEAQRERLTSSLSPQGVNVTAYTLEAVRIVFVELFCTPQSSMENPSLRANGHGGSTNRTFIVDNFCEDEFGQWTTDEVIGEQGYVDDEGSCSWTWDNHEYAWQSRPCRSRKLKKKVPAKERAKVDQQETEERPWGRTSARIRIVVRRGLCLVVQRQTRQERLFEG